MLKLIVRFYSILALTIKAHITVHIILIHTNIINAKGWMDGY